MVIKADFLLAELQKKVALENYDANKHIICPQCSKQTKQYQLSDGRRKCSRCKKKFTHKKRQDYLQKLQRYADIMVAFCFDFSAHRTAKYFHYRYAFVLKGYAYFRHVLAIESLGMEKLKGIVEADESYFGGVNQKRNKKYRKPYVGRGRGTDKTPVFGIQEREGKVFIDILKSLDEEIKA